MGQTALFEYPVGAARGFDATKNTSVRTTTRSIPVRAPRRADFLPDVIASDPYEDWLDLGEAMRESDPVVECAPKDKPLAA